MPANAPDPGLTSSVTRRSPWPSARLPFRTPPGCAKKPLPLVLVDWLLPSKTLPLMVPALATMLLKLKKVEFGNCALIALPPPDTVPPARLSRVALPLSWTPVCALAIVPVLVRVERRLTPTVAPSIRPALL